jgi:hypothetical protein
MWAFGYGAEEASQIWDRMPLDSDIVVTHTPPKYHRDERKDRMAAGCEALREALWRVRPRLAICGHVHEGRGVERIRWDLGMSNVKYKEISVRPWEDPGLGNKKMSLVDLTAKGWSPIENDGSGADFHQGERVDTIKGAQYPDPIPTVAQKKHQKPSRASPNRTAALGLSSITSHLLAVPAESLPPATRGQGGVPPSQSCDLEALSGRMGRQETCVINAAIMASSWPHGAGGKKFNKPIVVDIDLPIWEAD